ncbi:MAG: site-specific integrase [Nanoarchaeota archaeon]
MGNMVEKEAGKKPKKYNIYYLSMDEINKIIAASKNLRDRVVLKILARTGMRRFELCQLLVKHIDFNAKSIYIPLGKNKKPRSVPIDDDTLQDIKFYIGSRQHGKLIQSNNKKSDGIDETRVNAIVKNTAKKAGVKHPDPAREHLNPHIFRHSFIRHMIKQGVPPNYVQQIAGHSDIKVTLQMYGVPSFKDVQEEYQKVKESFYK